MVNIKSLQLRKQKVALEIKVHRHQEQREKVGQKRV